MKSMRQLINLMESVEAVPGLNEKSSSEKQARFMAAAAHDPKFAKKAGIEQDVAKEFNKADTGTELLSKAAKNKEESCSMEEAHVDTCRQTNGAPARDACAMEGADESEITDDMVRAAYQARHEAFAKDLPNKYQLADYASMLANKHAQQQSMKAHGKGFDPISGNLLPEDLNNGYDDVEIASGQDFFPNGADSPVVKAVGPSGARQGDNPEQKKMKVAEEEHRELVYAYRQYLKESAKVAPKKKLKENQQVLSDFEIQDYDLSFDSSSDSADISGSVSASATVPGLDGQPKDIGWDVWVEATCGIGWESDESPTGWNYKTDNPTYTSYTYATGDSLEFTSITFSDGAVFYINNEELTLQDAQQQIDPAVLKLLLDPKLFEPTVGKFADSKIQDMEPPEPDFDEPDRDDYYDSRY